MTSPQERSTEHDTVWNLLPWYLNGTLDDTEADAVRDHLVRCMACRDEAREQELIRAQVAASESRPERAPAAFACLVERIDAEAPSRPNRPTWPTVLRLAAVLALVIGIGASVLPRSPEFEVLAEPKACVGDLSVVFAPSATEAAITRLLASERLEIACPPTAGSPYRLRLTDSGTDVDSLARRLDGHGIVELALPSGAP